MASTYSSSPPGLFQCTNYEVHCLQSYPKEQKCTTAPKSDDTEPARRLQHESREEGAWERNRVRTRNICLQSLLKSYKSCQKVKKYTIYKTIFLWRRGVSKAKELSYCAFNCSPWFCLWPFLCLKGKRSIWFLKKSNTALQHQPMQQSFFNFKT